MTKLVKEPDLNLSGAGACVYDGEQQHQEILETVPLEEMKGTIEVQMISLQGRLMDKVLD